MEAGGSDNDGREFKNAEEMWREEIGDDQKKKEWYRNGVGYWEGVEASLDGVLGGYGHVNDADVKGSEAFLKFLLSDRFPDAASNRHLVALDCGSGIGRVTKNLLLRYFNEVDLVEPGSHFLEAARESLAPENVEISISLVEVAEVESRSSEVCRSSTVGSKVEDNEVARPMPHFIEGGSLWGLGVPQALVTGATSEIAKRATTGPGEIGVEVKLVDYEPESLATSSLIQSSSPVDSSSKGLPFGGFMSLEFTPEERRYDVIWVQWCIGHLADDDFVSFFKRAKAGLKPDGFFVLKENIAKSAKRCMPTGFVLDKEDRSITRSDLYFKELFKLCGLYLYKSKDQKGFPEELFAVKMYALISDMPKRIHGSKPRLHSNKCVIIQ
ncbi:hypothetical protein HHK36_000740 [Tetracentron sinense]|uniref:Alpha N-terminal protein methyltransferase 1 n=1 Tax=Tetracentron sinense TaxID=13715 RepID=A0A834ZW18_TETSI|nr:hypothetical protein HHK36_000740 [Tetracentron sinense]